MHETLEGGAQVSDITLEGGGAAPAYSENGSEDDDHEYSGPEPEDWFSAFFINFLGNSSPRYKIFVITSLGVLLHLY